MRRLILTLLALSGGCHELRLDLLDPGADATVSLLDAAAINSLDAGLDSGGLVLRYDFAGVGVQVLDRVGSALALARGGASLDDSGALLLDGVDDFVELPSHRLSALQSASVVSWVRWSGGTCWQHMFDFGDDDDAGAQAVALESLYVTLSTCPEGTLEARQERTGSQYMAALALSTEMLATERTLNIALTIDLTSSNMVLYLDGQEVAHAQTLFPISQLPDVNAWLGRSQWARDPYAHLRFDEFRIYDHALSADEIRGLFVRGADTP